MQRTTGIVAALLTGALFFCAGCSKKASAPPKVSTPRETLKNMQQAVLAGDEDAYLACFEASDEEKEVLRHLYDGMVTTLRFERAMTKAYGQDAVKMDDMKTAVRKMTDEKWIEKITIEVNDKTATAQEKDQQTIIRLVKKDGEWKILTKIVPDKKFMEVLIPLTQAMKDAMGKIGKDGYDAERIVKGLNGDRGSLKKNATMARILVVEATLNTYRIDIGHYPTEEEGGLKALRFKPDFEDDAMGKMWHGPYLDSEPKDAWGESLNYELIESDSEKGTTIKVRLWSNGKDRQTGTDDDIRNRNDRESEG